MPKRLLTLLVCLTTLHTGCASPGEPVEPADAESKSVSPEANFFERFPSPQDYELTLVPLPDDLRDRLDLLSVVLDAGRADLFFSEFVPEDVVEYLGREQRLDEVEQRLTNQAEQLVQSLREAVVSDNYVHTFAEGRCVIYEMPGFVCYCILEEGEWFVIEIGRGP